MKTQIGFATQDIVRGVHVNTPTNKPLTKKREDRVRRKLKRQGYALVKNRAYTYLERFQGQYMIKNPYTNIWVAGCDGNGFSMVLDEVEDWANS